MGHIIFWKRDDMPCYSLALKTEKITVYKGKALCYDNKV